MEEDNSSASLASAPHVALPISRSSESVYESCVSQLSLVPVAPSPPLTTTGETPSPFAHENHDDGAPDIKGITLPESGGFDTGSPDAQTGALATNVKKPSSRIPVLRLVKSPLSNQRFSGPRSPSAASPCDSLATTHAKSRQEEKEKAGGGGMTFIKKSKKPFHAKDTPPSLINRESPTGPFNATYRVSPVDVPYLSKGHTPKTVQQLQERLRSQTKGKLISLEELRKARSAICMSMFYCTRKFCAITGTLDLMSYPNF